MKEKIQSFGRFLSGMVMPNIGVIVGTEYVMFIGAMIMGPLAGLVIKMFDKLIKGKIPAGFAIKRRSHESDFSRNGVCLISL